LWLLLLWWCTFIRIAPRDACIAGCASCIIALKVDFILFLLFCLDAHHVLQSLVTRAGCTSMMKGLDFVH